MVSGTRDNPPPKTTLSRQPSPRVTLTELTLSLILFKIQRTVCIRIANTSRVASPRQVGTTFLQINALARLTGRLPPRSSGEGCFGYPRPYILHLVEFDSFRFDKTYVYLSLCVFCFGEVSSFVAYGGESQFTSEFN